MPPFMCIPWLQLFGLDVKIFLFFVVVKVGGRRGDEKGWLYLYGIIPFTISESKVGEMKFWQSFQVVIVSNIILQCNSGPGPGCMKNRIGKSTLPAPKQSQILEFCVFINAQYFLSNWIKFCNGYGILFLQRGQNSFHSKNLLFVILLLNVCIWNFLNLFRYIFKIFFVTSVQLISFWCHE